MILSVFYKVNFGVTDIKKGHFS